MLLDKDTTLCCCISYKIARGQKLFSLTRQSASFDGGFTSRWFSPGFPNISFYSSPARAAERKMSNARNDGAQTSASCCSPLLLKKKSSGES
ncbi:unnamed protein product [Coffea canephora]|uniref:Uncharacterized protein n=1 Tax=Coffea canephora TaxID=49390 RepID=A0A068VCF4_COFCA|nr:unnamed protein product [Coffea canephora]